MKFPFQKRKKAECILGKTFTRLTVLSAEGVSVFGKTLWRCRCVCGKESIVPYGALTSGGTKSCGCLRSDIVRTRCTKHGFKSRANAAPEYAVWTMMIQRCHNPKAVGYDNYGGRGISVHEPWRASFVEFINDMGRRPSDAHSIERDDNDGDYEPTNCVWATWQEQANNKRGNFVVEHNGESVTVAELARMSGVPAGILAWRLNNAWTVEEAISVPISRGGNPLSAAAVATSKIGKGARAIPTAVKWRAEVEGLVEVRELVSADV